MNTITIGAANVSANRCQERGQPCPREPKSRNWRTKLSALLFAAVITACLLMHCPASAHAQGGVPRWTNVGGPITAANTTATVSDRVGGDRQRFYRVALMP